MVYNRWIATCARINDGPRGAQTRGSDQSNPGTCMIAWRSMSPALSIPNEASQAMRGAVNAARPAAQRPPKDPFEEEAPILVEHAA